MNMQQIVQAMQKTQRELNKEFAKLEAKEFKANSNGVIEVTLLGNMEVKEIKILDDDLLNKENKEELSEMIILAINKCRDDINKETDAINAKFQKPGGMMF